MWPNCESGSYVGACGAEGGRAGRYKTFQGEQLGEGVKKRFYVEANGADASSEGQNCSYLATRSV